MPLNVSVSYADASSAFGGTDIKNLIQKIQAGHDPTTGLPMTRENIKIVPAPNVVSARREITWNLAMIIAESDEDNYEAFKKVMGSILGAATDLSATIAGLEAGLPPNPAGAINLIIKTMKDIDNVIEEPLVAKTIKIAPLKVGLTGRDGKPVSLKAQIIIDATWATDDPDDDDNKAWIETEALKIGTISDVRSSPNRWDASSWDPRKEAPANHIGRSFMEPHGEQDITGTFKTEPGNKPRRALMMSTASPIASDETFIDARMSVNVQADDTMVVVVERVILILEGAILEEKIEEKGDNAEKGDSEGSKKGLKTGAKLGKSKAKASAKALKEAEAKLEAARAEVEKLKASPE